MKGKDIPKTVKKLRTAMGLTQEQFAAKIGVTFSLADGKMAKGNLLISDETNRRITKKNPEVV